jgi:hypothetical protein
MRTVAYPRDTMVPYGAWSVLTNLVGLVSVPRAYTNGDSTLAWVIIIATFVSCVYHTCLIWPGTSDDLHASALRVDATTSYGLFVCLILSVSVFRRITRRTHHTAGIVRARAVTYCAVLLCFGVLFHVVPDNDTANPIAMVVLGTVMGAAGALYAYRTFVTNTVDNHAAVFNVLVTLAVAFTAKTLALQPSLEAVSDFLHGIWHVAVFLAQAQLLFVPLEDGGTICTV